MIPGWPGAKTPGRAPGCPSPAFVVASEPGVEVPVTDGASAELAAAAAAADAAADPVAWPNNGGGAVPWPGMGLLWAVLRHVNAGFGALVLLSLFGPHSTEPSLSPRSASWND